MKLFILIFSTFFSVMLFAQEKQYLFQDEANSFRQENKHYEQEIKKNQELLRSQDIIPGGVPNESLTDDQNRQVYALLGDSMVVADSAYSKYNWFYLEQWRIQKWGRYDERIGSVGKITISKKHSELITSVSIWKIVIITFCYLFIFIFLFFRYRYDTYGDMSEKLFYSLVGASLLGAIVLSIGIIIGYVGVGLVFLVVSGKLVPKYAHVVFAIICLALLGLFWYLYETPLFFISALLGILSAYVVNFLLNLQKKGKIKS